MRVPLRHRTAIVVDDGLATGATARAAVRALRAERPAAIVMAAPVGSVTGCAALRGEADALVCPHQPAAFRAVGHYYGDFAQTSDAEVQRLLREAGRQPSTVAAGDG
jgi:putative phosphoribosyl transferase